MQTKVKAHNVEIHKLKQEAVAYEKEKNEASTEIMKLNVDIDNSEKQRVEASSKISKL